MRGSGAGRFERLSSTSATARPMGRTASPLNAGGRFPHRPHHRSPCTPSASRGILGPLTALDHARPLHASISFGTRCRSIPLRDHLPCSAGAHVGVDCDTPRRNAQRAAMQGVGLVTICTRVLVKLSSNARDCVSVKKHAYFLGNFATSDNTGYVTQPTTGLPVIQNARPEPPLRGRDPPPAEGRSDRPSGPPRFSLDTRVPHACACAGRDITYPI